MRPDDQMPITEPASEAATSGGKTWTPPTLRKLQTSEAEFNISGTNPDTEGFTS